jgi:rhamnose transport system permease protein
VTAPARRAAARASRSSSGQQEAGRGALALRARFLGVLAFEVLLVAVFSILSDRFLSLGNARVVLFTAAILVVAVAGQSLVVLTGNLDLSVGSIMGLTAYVVYDVTAGNSALGALVPAIGMAVGAVLGLVNGFLVAVLELPSIVATLGTLAIYRGLTSLYSGAGQVTSEEIPRWIRSVADADLLGVPLYVVVAVAVVAVIALVLRDLPWGRRIYAYGSNPDAALFFGLDRTGIVIGAYVAAGVVAGLAGLMLGGQVGSFSSLLAEGYELQVLAAVVIGGISIWGGSGSVVGAALGAVVLATINNGLVLLQVNEFYRLLIQGLAIIVAVAVDAVVRSKVTRVTRRRRIMEAGA